MRLQREVPNMPDEENPPREKFASANSKGDQTTQRNIEKANIGVVYNRPVKPPIFTNDGGVPPWFERLRRELQNSNSTYLQPLQATNKRLARQRLGRFGESHLQSKNYARNPITLVPMGKDLLQKTRIALFVDSTIKSSYNSNNTLMDVRLMNMPCTTLNEMAEVTDKMFTPAAAETIPLPPILVYSNVIDHLALRGSLRHFDTLSTRFTEGFVTEEVTAYVETMSHIATMMKNKKPNTGTVFVSPPGYIYLPRALQQFLYLVLEASYARDLHFYIVAPNLRINVTTWRPCEASYPAFLADISKAIQGYTGYEGNSQIIVDEATAYDYGMQMSIRSLDENGVRKVFDPNESERKHLIDNLWFERRDQSTLDEKTHDPKFHKELLALFKETEMIKAERTNTTVFPIAAIATDAKLDMASLTLTLLMVMTRGLARQNEAEPNHTYQTWHKALRETLNQVALRREIPFPVFLYNISPFWLPSLVQAEFNLDDQQRRLYVEAMQKTTISEILAYSMAIGMHAVYRGPSGILQKLIFDKGHLPLFSYLVYAQNQKNWLQAILGALDPAGPLRLKKRLELNIEAILTWIYSTWVNVAGIMHPLDENPAINREPNHLPGFLFPSQMATLMLVETEDLIPLIAPIVWPIFGAVMVLRYPTQVLRMAANTPTFSTLHFVTTDGTQPEPTYRGVVANFNSLRPPMAKNQVGYDILMYVTFQGCAVIEPIPAHTHPIY